MVTTVSKDDDGDTMRTLSAVAIAVGLTSVVMYSADMISRVSNPIQYVNIVALIQSKTHRNKAYDICL